MTGSRILIVEDDPHQRAGLAEFLRRAGHEVLQASSAERALEILPSSDVDLLIADYQLGGATGAWLGRVAGRHGETPPQVLLLTGHADLADADDFRVLRKPLEPERFLFEVEQALAGGPARTRPVARQRIAFILYASDSVLSRRVIQRVKHCLADYDRSEVSLTIMNIACGQAHQAEEHRIIVTPTLLKTFPAPRVWLTGECDPAMLRRLLDAAGVGARP